MTKEQFLKDGDWWLVIARYPVACDASIQEVIESEDDPLKDSDYENELVNECVDSYSYLDEFTYDPELEKEEEYGEEDQYEDWYESQREGVEIYSIKIDEDVIDKYGIEWLNSRVA